MRPVLWFKWAFLKFYIDERIWNAVVIMWLSLLQIRLIVYGYCQFYAFAFYQHFFVASNTTSKPGIKHDNGIFTFHSVIENVIEIQYSLKHSDSSSFRVGNYKTFFFQLQSNSWVCIVHPSVCPWCLFN